MWRRVIDLIMRSNKTPIVMNPIVFFFDSVNMCKEVMDGLRIIFDFVFRTRLLYVNEASHFKMAIEKFEYKPSKPDNSIKT